MGGGDVSMLLLGVITLLLVSLFPPRSGLCERYGNLMRLSVRVSNSATPVTCAFYCL